MARISLIRSCTVAVWIVCGLVSGTTFSMDTVVPPYLSQSTCSDQSGQVEESGGARPRKIRRSPSGRVKREDRRRRLWMTRMRAVLQDEGRGGRGRNRMTLRAGTIGFLKNGERSSVVPVATAARI